MSAQSEVSPAQMMQAAYDAIKFRMQYLEPMVDEYAECEIAEGAMRKALDELPKAAPVTVIAPKKKPARKAGAGSGGATGGTTYTAPAKVTPINQAKSLRTPPKVVNKGGRPTKKSVFLKLCQRELSVKRDDIPRLLDTTVQKVNEFVPELVREGLVKIEERGDKHDPIEWIRITPDGQLA